MSGAPMSYIRFRPHIVIVPFDGKQVILGVDCDPLSETMEHLAPRLRTRAGMPLAEFRAALGTDADDLLVAMKRALQVNPEPFAMAVPAKGLETYFDTAMPEPSDGIGTKHVVIVGCGGTGTEVARHLVASRLGRLTLVDFDKVEQSNLNRQYLFREHQLGTTKVEALRESLGQFSSTTEVDVRSARVESVETLTQLNIEAVDAVVNCADTPRHVDTIVAEYARDIGAVFATGGVGVYDGSWGPVLLPGGPRYRALRPQIDAEYTRPTPASFGPTNAFISAGLARDLIHVLVGDNAPSLNAIVNVDFETLEVTMIAYNTK